MTAELKCPECGEEVWDGPEGYKLAKCWNSEGHASGGTLAFDTMTDCCDCGESVATSQLGIGRCPPCVGKWVRR